MNTPSPFVNTGRVMFALGLVGLAILGLMMNDFIVGRPPAWPIEFRGKETLSVALNVLLFTGSGAIIFQRQGTFTAFLIAAIIFSFSFLIRFIPALLKAEPQEILWIINAYKTLALVGGALIIGVCFLRNNSQRSAKIFLAVGKIFLSVFYVISGFAHFKFANFIIDDFMPSYIPFIPFWTYFCGVALIAGGIGIQINPVRKIAALLVGTMISVWFLLLHIPRFFANMNDPSDRMGLCESFAFAGIMFALYGLFKKKKE